MSAHLSTNVKYICFVHPYIYLYILCIIYYYYLSIRRTISIYTIYLYDVTVGCRGSSRGIYIITTYYTFFFHKGQEPMLEHVKPVWLTYCFDIMGY
jgi:hypothetical protein